MSISRAKGLIQIVCSHQLTPRKRALLEEQIDIFPSFHAIRWIITAFSSPPLRTYPKAH